MFIFTTFLFTSAWLVPCCLSRSMCSAGFSRSPIPARTLPSLYCLKIAVLNTTSCLSATGGCSSSQLLLKQQKAQPVSSPLGSLSLQALFLLAKKELLLTSDTLLLYPRLRKAASPAAKGSCQVWRRACLLGSYGTAWAAMPNCCRPSSPLQKKDRSCRVLSCFSASRLPNYVIQKWTSLLGPRQLCKGHTNVFFQMGKLRQDSCVSQQGRKWILWQDQN